MTLLLFFSNLYFHWERSHFNVEFSISIAVTSEQRKGLDVPATVMFPLRSTSDKTVPVKCPNCDKKDALVIKLSGLLKLYKQRMEDAKSINKENKQLTKVIKSNVLSLNNTDECRDVRSIQDIHTVVCI